MADNSQDLREITRHLKDIAQSQRDQTRLIKILSQKILQNSSNPSDPVLPGQTDIPIEAPEPIPPVESGRIFGWSMAAVLQQEGTLQIGDVKRWTWTGDGWERTELPSEREA